MQLDRDSTKWENTRSIRSEMGKIGGQKSGEVRKQKKANEAIASKSKQKKANEAVTVNVTVTDNVNVKDNVIIYRSFKHLTLSVSDFDKLILEGYTKIEIDNILNDIENYKKNTNYSSLYLTSLKWLKKEKSFGQKENAGKTAAEIITERILNKLNPNTDAANTSN